MVQETGTQTQEVTLLLSPSLGPAKGGWCLGEEDEGFPIERDTLVVSYLRSPDELIEAWRHSMGSLPTNFGIITFGNATRSATVATSEETSSFSGSAAFGSITSIERPSDFRALNNAVLRYLDEWSTTGRPSYVYLESVTPLLGAFPIATVFRFLHLLIARVRQTDAKVCIHLDPDTTHQLIINNLRPLFDDIVDLRTQASAARKLGDEPAVFSQRTVEQLLQVPRRRVVIDFLRTAEPPIHVRQLAKQIAEQEGGATNERTSDGGNEANLEKVYISLQHNHLPKLAEAGVLTLSEDRQVIEQTEHLEALHG